MGKMGSSKIRGDTFPTKTKLGNVRNNENHEYRKGSIVNLKLENFLTYGSVELSPGPHLNLIIGPNGTGKSTIVCAICLGLGGKTIVIGRANHVVDYIKHGCSKASITIELFNPDGRNWVITREITENNSTWKINDASVSLKDVENLVTELNIQVGNLCQFLPQDRVADFVRMNKQEMLENTEKAVGPPVMFEYHSQLKELRVQIRTVEMSFKNTKEYLENEKQKICRLEDDVKYFQERQRHLERIEILNKKRCWIVPDLFFIGSNSVASVTESDTEEVVEEATVLDNPQKFQMLYLCKAPAGAPTVPSILPSSLLITVIPAAAPIALRNARLQIDKFVMASLNC
ncbi:structural maintenance of chromosomes protein 5-like [Tachypleus tridentatus]|uniref:structural maintenance of chromosomes protein 5-like n=1 Tax=Tachypleus tridentatus TaxID=6853 RepID=UPI003FD3D2BA